MMKNKIIVGFLFCCASHAQAVVLITPGEATLPAASGIVQTRGITRGPGIQLVSPVAGENIKSPFNLKINFEERGGVKIDPASVKITYMKSPAVDLTSRLGAGVSSGGIVLNNAEVPPGEHQLNVKVKDADGRESHTVIAIKVSP
ncbi:hypothetical protein RGU70_04955 [Herbaspirillum sp. RTI4]|uniref:hypothetical protein n=1 Tax=Herbaspirillum sp. RTI4 TaxID=3048640 RepID=UPI002AB3C437|nr:hypothetical protein [Herbaspirillum sp. RTI4]MDY7577670.1 hypothetical protein [Herbaspirillum sp. RTI4]MEA9982164.1 hypothetical protein [Herbaspirillum sp. RTI4]